MTGGKTEWMRRSEAAAYLRLSVSGLAHMACRGVGPRFSKAGSVVRYRKSDLDDWLSVDARQTEARATIALIRARRAGR